MDPESIYVGIHKWILLEIYELQQKEAKTGNYASRIDYETFSNIFRKFEK